MENRSQAFVDTINQHKKIIYKVCHAYCKEAANREDLAQEILLQLWRAFPSYNQEHKFSTWMYKIALNVAISSYRKENKRLLPLANEEEKIFHLEAEIPDASNSELLYDYIHQLEELNKSIILLYLEDYSYKEIAEIMGITESNVGTKINRIKQNLKEYFSTK